MPTTTLFFGESELSLPLNWRAASVDSSSLVETVCWKRYAAKDGGIDYGCVFFLHLLLRLSSCVVQDRWTTTVPIGTRQVDPWIGECNRFKSQKNSHLNDLSFPRRIPEKWIADTQLASVGIKKEEKVNTKGTRKKMTAEERRANERIDRRQKKKQLTRTHTKEIGCDPLQESAFPTDARFLDAFSKIFLILGFYFLGGVGEGGEGGVAPFAGPGNLIGGGTRRWTR